ncbi:MAG TPA: hypothetical protein VFA89_21035 [Terriglobales bacterium]|nr:hypothetical protein [Terriglobales bacterium]
MSFASTLKCLSTPMLLAVLAAETHVEAHDVDEHFLKVVEKVLWYRNWPGTLSDIDLFAAADDIPMGLPLCMIITEMGKRGLDPADDIRKIKMTPEQVEAVENGASFCKEHSEVFWADEMCPECHHDELRRELDKYDAERKVSA